jgi:NACalpha-BTF3-like transcription factor
MQFGKIAQGDNSVLRDGDMAMLAGGYNYTSVGDMLGKLRAKAAGGNFNDTELKQMRKISEKVQELKGKRVQQLVSPIIQRAKANDLNLLESFDPAQLEEFSGKPSKGDELTTPSISPVAISDETREKRIKFVMDKGHSREEAIAALKEAGKI